MNIGIISDTHGCLNTWNLVYSRYFQDVDIIIHAGDVLYHGPRNQIPTEYNPREMAEVLNACQTPIVYARGNCDSEVDAMVLEAPIQSPYAYVHIEGLSIVAHHGHTLNEQEKLEMAKRFKANIFISGHTHLPILQKNDGIIFINPGSPAMSKTSDGRGTIAKIINRDIQLLDVVSGEILSTITLD